MVHVVNLDEVQNQWFMRPKHCFFTTEEASELKTKFRNEFFRKNWVYTRVSYLFLCLFSEILRLVNLDEDRGGARQISADESTFLDVQTLKLLLGRLREDSFPVEGLVYDGNIKRFL